MDTEHYTPNAAIENPNVRRVVNAVISTAAIVVGAAIALDGASPDIDIARYTLPASAVVTFLAGAYGIAVNNPNIPRA